jgi:hypothetical protein
VNAAQRKARAIMERDTLTDHCAMLLAESPGPLPAGLGAALERACDAARRPYFDDPREYVDYAGDCFARGQVPYGPEDVEQLKALNAAFPVETRWHFRHTPKELAAMGLPKSFYDEVKPWSERRKDEFLETIQCDRTFARATVALYRHAAQG